MERMRHTLHTVQPEGQRRRALATPPSNPKIGGSIAARTGAPRGAFDLALIASDRQVQPNLAWVPLLSDPSILCLPRFCEARSGGSPPRTDGQREELGVDEINTHTQYLIAAGIISRDSPEFMPATTTETKGLLLLPRKLTVNTKLESG